MGETWSSLVLYLWTILGTRDSAQDAAQEAFVRLWERREQWESGSARALVFRIGRNVALDIQRRAQFRRRWAREHLNELQVRPFKPDEELEASEFEVQFRGAIENLPTRRREVFELVRFQGLTYQEVAEVLELSPQTVANQMVLAHRDLRRLLIHFLAEPVVGRDRRNPGRSSDG